MKHNTGIEMFLVALLLGVAIGILYSRWLKIENQIAGVQPGGFHRTV